MNSWLIFILFIIFFSFIVDTLVSLLNIKALRPELPAEFSETCDDDKYRQSQRYTRSRTLFSISQNTISTVAVVFFMLTGGFNMVDQAVRSLGYGSITTGILFTGLLLLLSSLLSLPFTIYSTFRLEERFGFNRTTPQVFITDLLKTVLLSIIIGTPLLALILWFFESGGNYAWLFCWAGVVLFSFLLQFLAPVVILPLFNKFTPLQDGPLKEKIISYADKESFTISGIFTMDGSKRSAKLNAFFTGFGKFRKIVFFDTLLAKADDEEIIAVLAHEMGHFKKKHIWKLMGATTLQTGLLFYLLSLFINNRTIFNAFQMEEVSIYASLVFFLFIYSPLSTILAVLFNFISRKYEFEADRYAARSTQDPEALVRGLKKLSLENLSNLTPHPAMVIYSYSHPPVLERIKALQQIKI